MHGPINVKSCLFSAALRAISISQMHQHY